MEGLGRRGVFEGVTFDLHRGEVLGLAGLIGAGRTDVGLALFGIEPATSGTIRLKGAAIAVRSPPRTQSLAMTPAKAAPSRRSCRPASAIRVDDLRQRPPGDFLATSP